jgi:acyl phosphate:glycerol-3-phosphate acyltransferase
MTQLALATAFMSYVLGSFPTALIIGKKYLRLDIRSIGTRNMGAYNVYRSVGWLYGLLTLILDALKGFLPVIVALHLNLSYFWVGVCASMALIGHNWPIFTHFKGGKGGSTSAGILLALFPGEFPFVFIFFCLLVFLSKNLSFGLGFSILIFPMIALSTSKPSWMIFLSLFVVFIGLIRIYPYYNKMMKLSQGDIKKMLLITLKGFKHYECSKYSKS